MQRDDVMEMASECGLILTQYTEDFASKVASKQRTEMLRLLKETCKPYGKAGECVYSTFKHSLEKAKK